MDTRKLFEFRSHRDFDLCQPFILGHVDYSKIEVDRVFWLKFSEPGEGGVAQPLDTFRRNVYCMCKGNGAIVKLPKNNERILRVAKQQQPSSDIMACAGNPAIRAEDQNGYFFDVTFELVQYLQSREGKDAGGKVVRFIDRNAKPLQDLKYYFDQNKSVPRYPPE